MALMVAVIFGSTALEYHAKMPTTSWMRLMRAGDMAGEVSFSSICILSHIGLVMLLLGRVAVVWVWRVGICVGL